MPTFFVSSAAELSSALSSATGGDEILLEAGRYGRFDFSGRNYSDDVTIRSETPLGARFERIDVTNSSHLRIDGVHVDNPGNGGVGSGFVEIGAGTAHIAFVNSEVNGSVDGQMAGSYGIRVDDGARHVEIANNLVHDVKHGAVFFGVRDLKVTGNSFGPLGSDSMKFASVTNALIENNTGAAVTVPVPSDHIDFIQFQGSGTGIEIRGNVLLLEESANKVHQGIFLKDGVFRDVLIEQNLIYTNTVNGIFVQSNAGTGGNVTIRENTVLATPDATIWGNADIRMVSLAGSYTIENNVVDRVADSVGNGTVRNNLGLQWENPGAANHYDSVYVNATAGAGATIEDFRPVPGGPAGYGSGLGAEVRIAELLAGGSGAPGNARPDAVDDSASVVEDGTVKINVLANDGDPDGDAVSVASVGNPARGSAELNGDGTITYTPDADFSGADNFTYTLRDANGGTDRGTVRVTVTPSEDAPVARNDSFSATAGGEVTVNVLANDSDPDGDALTLVGHGATSNGELVSLGGGRFTYTPDADFSGTDSFSYTIRDPSGRTDTATVTFEVLDFGALPAPVFAGNAMSFSGRTSDARIVAHNSAYELASGTLEIAFKADGLPARQGLVTKDASYFGTGGHIGVLLEGDDILVRLQDTSTSHTIRAANAVSEGTEHHLALTFGAGGMALWLDGTRIGSNAYTGGLQGNREPLVIGANQWGSSDRTADKLEHAFDGTIGRVNLFDKALSGAEIELLAGSTSGEPLPETPPEPEPNAAPVAADDRAATEAGTAVRVDVRANDRDPDGDTLSVTAVGAAGNGTVAKNADGTVTYTPAAGFSGTDAFVYTLSDGALTDTARVEVAVAAPPPEPDTPSEPNTPPEPDTPPEARLIGAAFGTGEITLPRDVLVVAPDAALEVEAATLALEFNADRVNGRHGLMSKDASHFVGGGHHFTSYIEDGELFVRYQDGAQSEVLSVGGIVANRDYAFQTSFGNGEVALWLDGALVDRADFDTTWTRNAEYLQIGANGWASQTGDSRFEDVFDGTLADAVVAEGVLTPAELAALTAAAEPQMAEAGLLPSALPEPILARPGTMTFSGASSDVEVISHSDALELTEGTISFSFSNNNIGWREGLFTKDAAGYGEGGHFAAYLERGDLVVRFQSADQTVSFRKEDIESSLEYDTEAGREYDVDVLFTADGVSAYVDGQKIGQANVRGMSWVDNTETMQIGGLGWSSRPGDDGFNSPFSGTISDFAIRDQAIVPGETARPTEDAWQFDFF